MLSPWLTLVAEAYPLICPVASSPPFDQNQPLEPGCWFSRTIGLSAASVELTGTVAAEENRHSRAATTIRLNLIDAAPSSLGPLGLYLARCGGRGAEHLTLRWRRASGIGSPRPPLSSGRSGRGRRRGGPRSHEQKARLLGGGGQSGQSLNRTRRIP